MLHRPNPVSTEVRRSARPACGLVEALGPEDVAGKIADIAAQCGAVLYTDDPQVLDLLDEDDPVKACREWLAD